jgi:hypothetical protein
VDPRADLDDVEKRKFLTEPGLEFRPLGRPARSQSLYRLRYPGNLRGNLYYRVLYITSRQFKSSATSFSSTFSYGGGSMN